MSEEEKQQDENQEPEAAEEPEAPEAAEEQPGTEPEPEGVAEPVEEAAAEQGAAERDLGPKARRRMERSRASEPARPPRTPEQRATERADRRSAARESRRRHRTARRDKRGEPGTGTPAAPSEPGAKKVRQGTVVSAGGDKTITVEIAVVRRHPTYEKVVRRTSKLHAHDEANEAQQGDLVRVVESRPLSRTKRWRLLDILERAPR
jgi:small subunit ribosomal protein S17